jgi:hypothetical protein
LNEAEDIGHLPLESGKFEVDDGSARVKDDVDWSVERGEVSADGFAHPTLDAVAVDGFAHGLADGESDAWTDNVSITQ